MDKSRYVFFTKAVLIFLFIQIISMPVMAGITNGDFSQDPEGFGWMFTDAEVYSDSTAAGGNGFAVLSPYFGDTSVLYQDGIFLLPAETQLSFDFEMYKTEEGGETDIFTATFGTHVYTLESSDISGLSYSETVVFDLTGWSPGPYTLTFHLANDPDGIFTSVNIDNVQLIPAPGALLLAMIGTITLRKLKLM